MKKLIYFIVIVASIAAVSCNNNIDKDKKAANTVAADSTKTDK